MNIKLLQFVTKYEMFSIIFLLYEIIAVMISTNQVFKHLGWSTLEFTQTRPSSAASSEQGIGSLTDKIKEKEHILFHNWYKSLMKEICKKNKNKNICIHIYSNDCSW